MKGWKLVTISNEEQQQYKEELKDRELYEELYKVDYSKYKHIKVEKKDGVALVTLNRPPHNFIPPRMLKELVDIPLDLGQDPEVRAVVFTAEGENFCGGGDYQLFDFLQDKNDITLKYLNFDLARRSVWNWIELEKPSVAAVHGLVVGITCQITLLCDLTIAADDETTRFRDGHMLEGKAPGDGGVLAWTSRIGLARAKQYLYTSDDVYAREAERIGLINAVVPPDKLLPTAIERATRLANLPVLAIRWAKSAMNQYLRLHAIVCQNYAWALQHASRGTPDEVEAMAALREDRPAKFFDVRDPYKLFKSGKK